MKYFINRVSDLLINFENVFHIYTKKKKGMANWVVSFGFPLFGTQCESCFAFLTEAYSVAVSDILF